MSKKELYELRKRLIDSEKYKMIIIDGSDDRYINLDIVYNDHTYLKENITDSYKSIYDKYAVDFLEKNFKKLMIILAEKNIPYNSIQVLICPIFFMKEYNINDVKNSLNIEKNAFNNNMLIDNNLVSISYLLSAKLDEEIIDNKDINEFIDRVSSAKFLVDYNNFARNIALNDYPLENYSYNMLVDSQINNKPTIIKLNFNKEKTL